MKKIISAIIVFFLIFGVLLNGVPRAVAETSFGAAIGKATGAAVACWATIYLKEMLGKEVASKVEGYIKIVTDPAKLVSTLLSVPVFDFSTNISIPTAASKISMSQAMIKSKDCMRDVLAKIIIDWLVDQIIVWIQGGGEPKFVTDWEAFLSDAFNAGVGTVINESNFRYLCSPFRSQVRLTLLPVKSFAQRVECTLDDVVDNIEDFYNDFSKGGWIAYNEMWQPQNNYYGQILLYYDEAMMKGLAAKEAAEDEAAAGRGFLPVKRCIEYVSPEVTCGDEESREEYEACVVSVKANPDKADCVKWEAHTPGYVVGELAAEAMTSDIKWAYNIKSWVAAIINAAINRLITEGLSYMKGSQEEYDTKKGDFTPSSATSSVNYGGADFTSMDKSSTESVVEIYKRFLADSKAILASKQSSLSSVQSIIKIYDDITSKGCAVNQNDYNKAQTAQSTLQSDISKIQNLINEIQSNLDEAKAAAAAEDNEAGNKQRLAVLEKYNKFAYEKYPKILMGEYAGFTKSEAKDEADEWSGKLTEAKDKQEQCSTTATSTQP